MAVNCRSRSPALRRAIFARLSHIPIAYSNTTNITILVRVNSPRPSLGPSILARSSANHAHPSNAGRAMATGSSRLSMTLPRPEAAISPYREFLFVVGFFAALRINFTQGSTLDGGPARCERKFPGRPDLLVFEDKPRLAHTPQSPQAGRYNLKQR